MQGKEDTRACAFVGWPFLSPIKWFTTNKTKKQMHVKEDA